MQRNVTIVGGGLAGSEAAWQAAQRGMHVKLYEMRPTVETGAHQSDQLGELVCSNSLGSSLPDRASGILISELERMGSLLIRCARERAVPAGSALAVDRVGFSEAVTKHIVDHENIEIIREEVRTIPEGLSIIATGPLTSDTLSKELSQLTGEEHLYFFDALSPIIESSSIDFEIAFRASRYDRGIEEQGDYINCPFTKEEYDYFVRELIRAERIPLRSFENAITKGVKAGMSQFFESCLPVEIIAERGHDSLAFGPMRPVGLNDPRTGRRPHAVVQLRQDDLAGELFNLVGFQTNLSYGEQRRVFRLIPGLRNARFARYGQMHRNTFLNSPKILTPSLQHREQSKLLFAGQITGVEGYLGNIATGLLAGVNASRLADGEAPVVLPQTTMLGALCHYITHAPPERFQPMKANLGILPPLADGKKRNRRERARVYAERAGEDFDRQWHLSGEDLRIATQVGTSK
jgi:methylenetetrahydrofolate--tRNA-(uracil-5-)-methyltransferase